MTMDTRRRIKSTDKTRKSNPDTHKKVSFFNLVVFFGMILLADVILIFSHNKLFSENENRVLQQAPVLTVTSLTSGKYMQQAEDFVADQFFARDRWIYSKFKIDRILGRKESNGVYLGKNGYLLEAPAAAEKEKLDRTLSAIKSFASAHSGLPQVLALVPNALTVYPEAVSAGLPSHDQTEDLAYIGESLDSSITYVNLLDCLSEQKQEQLYYKSDHHWTSLGARYAFEALAGTLNLVPGTDYRVLTVADDFSGTMAASSGNFTVTDQVDLFIAQPEVDYYLEYSGDPVKYSSIYDSSALDSKNKYEVFFGGNYPKIKITTVNETGRNLLLIKDSYANCFVQFLLPYFDQIIMIDPRYYSDDLEAEFSNLNITDLLYLYGANTFVQDNSLAGVLES